MTYLVLARKWRPRSFETLVGQDHVVRVLTQALTTQRLHHAWLFTGTRGVGKTTLSRILAKALNCERGITAQPCGQCRPCIEIDAGHAVDYLELDAASNRGVEEMTQLLEQAVYAPSACRFKVYMIDEVHMLTGHAFNAMLKTLEEPPLHVKFILATTDPQKIPATVLSRCLQLNLKQLPPSTIVGYLQEVLPQEDIKCEVPALQLLAQAASGSMRDALSLTDQAIAYSAGHLTEALARDMLGTIDQRHLVRLLDALSLGDARAVLAVADEFASRGLSYSRALADLAVLLSRVAIEQRAAGATSVEEPLAADIARLAQGLHPDAVQLFYSIAVHSRHELSLAPDEYAGFVMACLRMMAFNGDVKPPAPTIAPPSRDVAGKQTEASVLAEVSGDKFDDKNKQAGRVGDMPETASAMDKPFDRGVEDLAGGELAGDMPETASVMDKPFNRGVEDLAGGELAGNMPAKVSAMDKSFNRGVEGLAGAVDAASGVVLDSVATTVARASGRPDPVVALDQMSTATWPELAARLPLTGLAAELAHQSAWVGVQDGIVTLQVAVKTLADSASRTRLQTALCAHFGLSIGLAIKVGKTGSATAHAVAQHEGAARQQAAEAAAAADPFVQGLLSNFGGYIVPGSIRHRDPPPEASC